MRITNLTSMAMGMKNIEVELFYNRILDQILFQLVKFNSDFRKLLLGSVALLYSF